MVALTHARLIRRIAVVGFLAIIGIACALAYFYAPIRSLRDAVEVLKRQGHLPPRAVAQIPPIATSLLGYSLDKDGLPQMASRCFQPGPGDESQSVTSLVIRYRSMEEVLGDLGSGQAAGRAGASYAGKSTLTLDHTFVRHALGTYDPASACDAGSLKVITWEWGAKRASLGFESETAASAALESLKESNKTTLSWGKSDGTTLVATDVVLAFDTTQVETTTSGAEYTLLQDPIQVGTSVGLPAAAPSDISLTVLGYDARTQLLKLQRTGRPLNSPCNIKDPNVVELPIGVCRFYLESASLLELHLRRTGERLEVASVLYRSKFDEVHGE